MCIAGKWSDKEGSVKAWTLATTTTPQQITENAGIIVTQGSNTGTLLNSSAVYS